MAQLQLKGIRKTYGNAAQETLKGIDINIESGEFLILVGPSGCGKSTLMNSIAGLESITEGGIYIDGEDVTHAEPKDRDIAMVFQSYALYPTMTVRENIAFGLKIRRMPKNEIETEVQRVAKLLQIEPLLDRKPAKLSGGQQQRVAMGRALARRPKIYLFDEPLSNLDAKLRVEMRTEIKRLHQRLGTTIVYVTHDQIEAMTLADRIAVIKDGELLQLGTPKEVYESPATRYVASFIDGDEMFVPLPEKLSAWHGREIHLGIRPEHITQPLAHKQDQATIASGIFRIEVTEPTGPDVMALTHINGTEVHCRLDPDHTVAPGQPAELMIDMSRAVFFEAGQEARIDA